MADIVHFTELLGASEDRRDDVHRACAISGIYDAIRAKSYYEDQVSRWALECKSSFTDKKLFLKHRKKLRSYESMAVLLIVWKESEFVSPKILSTAGGNRWFEDRDLTQNALAMHMASPEEGADDVQKKINLVSTIKNAAEAFSLLEVDLVHTKKSLLKPTPVLDRIFRKVGQNIAEHQ